MGCRSGDTIWTGQLDASGSNIELRSNGNQEIIKGTISTDFSVIDFGDFKWMELSSIPVTTSKPATTEQPPVDDGLNAADCAGKVAYKFRSGKAKVSRTGENSNLVRLQNAKVKETKAHTGFVSFTKSACGKDFLAGLKDGRVTVDFADKKATYSVIGSYYVDNGSSTQVVVQYNSVPASVADDKCPKCLGNTSTDQLEMLVMGTKSVEWGNKNAKACLNGALVGHAGATGSPTLLENDESGCVAWTNAL